MTRPWFVLKDSINPIPIINQAEHSSVEYSDIPYAYPPEFINERVANSIGMDGTGMFGEKEKIPGLVELHYSWFRKFGLIAKCYRHYLFSQFPLVGLLGSDCGDRVDEKIRYARLAIPAIPFYDQRKDPRIPQAQFNSKWPTAPMLAINEEIWNSQRLLGLAYDENIYKGTVLWPNGITTRAVLPYHWFSPWPRPYLTDPVDITQPWVGKNFDPEVSATIQVAIDYFLETYKPWPPA